MLLGMPTTLWWKIVTLAPGMVLASVAYATRTYATSRYEMLRLLARLLEHASKVILVAADT
eukprot:SAG31_NODE_2530_length_5556_cov_2.442917_7_plen_61_part_00